MHFDEIIFHILLKERSRMSTDKNNVSAVCLFHRLVASQQESSTSLKNSEKKGKNFRLYAMKKVLLKKY